MTEYAVPFNKPSFEGNERAYMEMALAAGWIAGDGGFTRRCNQLLQEQLGVQKALLTTSCTHALELSALLLDIGPGDEVIVPAFTFVSSANAFVLRGARPVFIDVRPDTLNLDEALLPSLLSERTAAIVAVHYAGVGCEMDDILGVASGIPVVEDNAHGLFGTYRGRSLGSLGRLATQSFHETKNFSCGEGGALLINDPDLVSRAEIMRDKGTNRASFFRGEVDKYTWTGLGSSYPPSDLLAAVLLAQLEARERIQGKRRRIWERYAAELSGWAAERGASLPTIPAHCEHPYHLFHMVLPSLDDRTQFIEHLKRRGILSVFHYQALNASPYGQSLGGEPGTCPVAEDVSDRLVRLPFFNSLSESEQSQVIEAVISFAG